MRLVRFSVYSGCGKNQMRREAGLSTPAKSQRNHRGLQPRRDVFRRIHTRCQVFPHPLLTSVGLPLQWENRSKSQSHETFRTGGVAFWPLPPAVLVYCRGPRLFSPWLCAGAEKTPAARKLYARPTARGCVHWKYRARESRCTVNREKTGATLNAGP